jgi:hypothetical protein
VCSKRASPGVLLLSPYRTFKELYDLLMLQNYLQQQKLCGLAALRSFKIRFLQKKEGRCPGIAPANRHVHCGSVLERKVVNILFVKLKRRAEQHHAAFLNFIVAQAPGRESFAGFAFDLAFDQTMGHIGH